MHDQASTTGDMSTAAVIPAAGVGVRMGADRAKQFLALAGKPILVHTLEAFQACAVVDAVLLVAPAEETAYCRDEVIGRYGLNKVLQVIPGGRRRLDSVRLGLEASQGRYGLVVIHDGVRPLVQPGLIEKAVAEARQDRAVITALPAKETVKEVDADQRIVKTYDRRQVWMVQTPQVFHYEDIMAAHQRAVEEQWEGVTDDAMLLERMGMTVKVIEGSEDNIKVTTPHDLALARFLLSQRDA